MTRTSEPEKTGRARAIKIRILSASDVHDLLTFSACAQAMRDVLARLARGEAQQVARTMLQPDGTAGA